MILNIIIGLGALIIGGLCGYLIFRYIIKGKYNEMITNAEKAAEVLKEKKLLEAGGVLNNKKKKLNIVKNRFGHYFL